MAHRPDRDRADFWKDMVIVFHHPDFQDMKPVDALAELKRRRRPDIETTDISDPPHA